MIHTTTLPSPPLAVDSTTQIYIQRVEGHLHGKSRHSSAGVQQENEKHACYKQHNYEELG